MSTTSRGLVRRTAVALLALGALVMSAGVAMMTIASPAQGAVKVNVCHATGSDSNPYVFINVAAPAVINAGHLMHRNTPVQTWKSPGIWNGVEHKAGDPKRDYISDFTAGGTSYVLDGVVTSAFCGAAVTPVFATATLNITQPTCQQPDGTWTASASHATFPGPSAGLGTAGGSKSITFTADAGYTFAGGATTLTLTRTFDPTPAGCGVPVVPETTPAAPTATQPSCANNNTAAVHTTADPGVSWSVNPAAAPGATVTVTATPANGYAFTAGAQTQWTITFDPAELNCNNPVLTTVVPAPPTYTEPSCANGNVASVVTPLPLAQQTRVVDVDGVRYTVTGDEAPGGTVQTVATALPGFAIDPAATTTWGHTFRLAESPCAKVAGPGPVTDISHGVVVTPTVVHAGLVTQQDLRGEQGMALVGTGAILLLAGGLGLFRTSGRRART